MWRMPATHSLYSFLLEGILLILPFVEVSDPHIYFCLFVPFILFCVYLCLSLYGGVSLWGRNLSENIMADVGI